MLCFNKSSFYFLIPNKFKSLRDREQLPVYNFKNEILAAIDKNPVIIVRGATGKFTLMNKKNSFNCLKFQIKVVVRQLKYHNIY